MAIIINGRGRVGARVISGGGVAYDSDAQAFFSANYTLTDLNQKNSINQFAINLKSFGLFSLGKYLYFGFLGDSTKVKYNFFNPTSNILTLSSGWTYDGQGMQGNGTSAYAQTGFIPSGNTDKNSQSIGVYSQTNVDELGCEIGSFEGSNREHLFIKSGGIGLVNLGASGYYTPSVSTSKGFVLLNRVSQTNITMFVGNTKVLNDFSTYSTYDITIQDYLSSLNNGGTAQYFSTKKNSLYFRFSGLNDTQVSNLKTCIETLLTSLSIPTW
jgi:hypothetical protein